MKLAIASGKGGTGKTTLAVNLALIAPGRVRLLDCDVEEPNCHLFLKPEIVRTENVTVAVPEIDESLCDACGECGRFCEFKAIVSLMTTPLVFPEMCHGCGGCALVCPQHAITEGKRVIGVIEEGRLGSIAFAQGRLRVGEAMAPPLIRAVKQSGGNGALTILDAPPGTSCPVITAVRGCDYVLLVTEPTPFGLNDLSLAVDTMRQLHLPFGVVINRCDVGDDYVRQYCRHESIPILAEIPDERRVAEAYSRGEPIVTAIPQMRGLFEDLYRRIMDEHRRSVGVN
jgi:MinD superfamily P-loop ATPase